MREGGSGREEGSKGWRGEWRKGEMEEVSEGGREGGREEGRKEGSNCGLISDNALASDSKG